MNTPTHFLIVACIPVQQPAYKPTERSARLTRSSGIALGIRPRPHRETVADRVAREAAAFAKLNTQDETGEVFWDESDPESVGWAYRITIYAREADDHGVRHPVREESGTIDKPSDLSGWF